MKLLAELASDFISSKDAEDCLVHAMYSLSGVKMLDNPIFSSQVECLTCGGKKGVCCFLNLENIPDSKNKKLWICVNAFCATLAEKSRLPATLGLATSNRAVTWRKFCESEAIKLGDVYNDVTFEGIEQNKEKIEFLLKFASNPNGQIIVMQGLEGRGKTYAALGFCELITRKTTSVYFKTHDRLVDEWLEKLNEKKTSYFKEKLIDYDFLVIDDFGTKDPTPGFMSFFFDVINSRIQWKSKGTIITTNLTLDQITGSCGAAFGDRLKAGQSFAFTGPSRRKKKPL